MSARFPSGKDDLRYLSRQMGVPLHKLLAMDPSNDPFNTGSPADVRDAHWFADVFGRVVADGLIHLRRVHYVLVSHADVTLPDGSRYINTEHCWKRLSAASAKARALGLVDATRLADKRNPATLVHSAPDLSREGRHVLLHDNALSIPSYDLEVRPAELSIKWPVLEGFDYRPEDQPDICEVWVEKSTMNDVLEPLCRRHAANLVTGLGYLSITRAVESLVRAQRQHRNLRVLYVSDFDPAGNHMAPSVARQLEYYRNTLAISVDISVERIVLTRGQVDEFALPRIPIKDSDLRKANFEERNGSGAVELDALEALHPGELARVLTDALDTHHDDDLVFRLASVQAETQTSINNQWGAALGDLPQRLDVLRAEAEAEAEPFIELMAQLDDEFRHAMQPVTERLDELQGELDEVVAGFDPELPQRPRGESPAVDAAALFDSDRDYLEQLPYYREAR